MKKVIAAFLLLAIAGDAWCNPYFRIIDPAHPQPVAGGLINPLDLKASSIGSLLPLVTHSPNDGCLLPKIVCEDWSPLAVGGSMNAGKATVVVGPLFNVLPWVGSAARAITPSSMTGVQAVLNSPPATSAVTFSGGPMWEFQQATNKGYFEVFTGLALHF